MQTCGAESGEQVAHIPIVVVATGAFEGVNVVDGHEMLAFALSPVESVDCTCDIFGNGDIGGVKRGECVDEDTIDIEKKRIERYGEY